MSAADHKEKARTYPATGNAAFKAGDYPNAIGHYTSAILADASDPTFPLNRAAAYLKLGKNEDAERDCATVLKLQATNVKALFRRAQARVAIGKLSDARADLVAAAKAEPGNAAVRAEFQKVEELIAAAAKKAKAGKGTPIAIPTRPQPSGTPYRRRVPISVVDDDAKKEDNGKGKEPATPLKSILKGTSSLSISEPSSPPKPKSRDLLTAVSTRTISSTSAEAPVTKSPTPTPSPAPVTTAPNPVSPPPTEPTPQKSAPSTSQPTPPSSAQAVTPSASQDATPPAALPPHPDAKPPTLAVFLQKWSNTRTDADRAAIFFAIPPDSIPSLFGPTLESPLLGSILGALSSVPADERQRTVEYLVALSRVPRFSTLVLFLNGSEKICVRGVWDVIQAGDVNGVDVAQERKKWGC